MAIAPTKASNATNSPLVKVVLGALLCILLLLGYLFLFHFEQDEKITREKARTAQLQAGLAEARRKEASYFQDRDELAMREHKQREYNRVLPADAEPAAFLSAIQSVANIAGVNLKGWQPLESVKESFFARVPMKLEIEGRFHQIARFSFELGRTDRIINLENLDISDPKVEADEVVLKARCLATTFHLLKPGDASKPTQAGGMRQ